MATIRIPEVVPSPEQDCERLKEAFKGLGTDEKAVVWILGHRNASQRKQIRETFQQLYKKSLIDELHSELTGDFRKAVILWTYDPPERDARLAHEALKCKKKKVDQLQVIVEIACATSPDHLVAVRKAYCYLFDDSLEEDIISHVPNPIGKILVSLVRSYRYDREVVDSSLATMEAGKLHEAIQAKKLDDDELVQVLSTRNVFQLRETFRCYMDHFGKSIDQDIMDCGEGTLESVMKVLIWCIAAPERHFAEVIRNSVVGLGTDEDSLTRAIVTRAEVDLANVKDVYTDNKTHALEEAVGSDTSRHYKSFLLTLLGAKF